MGALKVKTKDGSYKPAESGSSGAVKYIEQSLTQEQQAMARENIGASEAEHTHPAITTAQIDAILDS